MTLYHTAFPKRHTVLPVIHVESRQQSLRNAKIARDTGADGVFLINHGIAGETLLEIQDAVASKHKDWWVGVNCLDMKPSEAFKSIGKKVRGLWMDNAGIQEDREDQPLPLRVWEIQQERASQCLYFGGVAFKYQRPVQDLEAACITAARFMDVVTTSGPGTGHAADVEKIRRMKVALGETPLAIASGITPENVNEYLPVADCFLVATGISLTFSELDEVRVKQLMAVVRAYSESH
ncbi:hypothetical protein BH11PLA2_BH11PLA2_25370 [soil metagenome]